MSQFSAALKQVHDVALVRTNQEKIDYSANNPVTREIDRSNPIKYLDCRLHGNFTSSSANGTPTDRAIANLIETLILKIDNKDVVASIPGFMLPILSQLYTRSEPYIVQPTFATADTGDAWEVNFRVPIDAGRYFSLLDAAGRNSLICEVKFNGLADVVGGSGTHAVTNVEFDIETVGIAGAAQGVPGGRGFGYARHLMQFRDITVTAAETKVINLHKGHLYQRVLLYTESDAVAVDTILNSVTIKIGQNEPQEMRAASIQAVNFMRYGWTAHKTGLYVVDFMEPEHIEHMLAVNGTQRFDLLVSLNKPGTTDKVYMLEDVFVGN